MHWATDSGGQESKQPHREIAEGMIVVTRLNGSQFAINPDLIERIHENPDTTIFMVDGSSYIVIESLADVVERMSFARARIIALAMQFRVDNGVGADSEKSRSN